MVKEASYAKDSVVNTLDGRVMDPVYVGQYPTMGCFQPSVTHRDYNIGPFICQCPKSTASRNLDQMCTYQSGHWHTKGYLPDYIYGPYGDYGRSCHRFLTTYRTDFPEHFRLRAYPYNDLHVQPTVHTFRARPFF